MSSGVKHSTNEVTPWAHLLSQELQDHPFHDALFLTFNADLGFFERRLLGWCAQGGARVTIVADGSVWNPDPRSIRFAGRDYHVGLAAPRLAFHPKLMLAAGPQQSVAIIGSGNLTLGGWQYNRELSTVLTGDATTAPRAMVDLRDQLAVLTEDPLLDPFAADGLRRCVGHLRVMLAGAEHIDTGHRVSASWSGRLLDQLPSGPVDSVALSAPFHDMGAKAVQQVLDRLQPRRVCVAIQPGMTFLDPHRLAAVLEDYRLAHDAVVETIDDDGDGKRRYRHGKLIEWTVGADRFALTGSPNLSAAALLNAAGNSGNYELAVIGPVTGPSLMPTGALLDLASVPQMPARLNDDAPGELAGPMVLAAIARESGLEVFIARAGQEVTVQIAHAKTHPDDWDDEVTVRPVDGVALIDTGAGSGSRVRLRWTGEGKQPGFSPTVYVSDLRTSIRRPVAATKRSRGQQGRPVDLWGSEFEMLNNISADLQAVAVEMQAQRTGAASSTGPDASADPSAELEGRRDRDEEAWLWTQQVTERRVGVAFAQFALALPTLGGGEWIPDWTDKAVSERTAGLDDDTAEELDEIDEQLEESGEEDRPEEPIADHRRDSNEVKRRRRTWAVRHTQLAQQLPLELRLFITLVTLRLWLLGNWVGESDRDAEPTKLLDQLIRLLEADQTSSSRLTGRASTVSLLVLTFMRQELDLSSHTEESLRYRQLVADVGYRAAASDNEVARDYLRSLVDGWVEELWLERYLDLVSDLMTDDPLADLEDSMTAKYDVTRPGPRFLLAQGRIPNPALTATQAAGQVEDADRVAVWAQGYTGAWAVAVWRRPDLVVVSEDPGRRTRWRHFRATLTGGPAAIAHAMRTGDNLSSREVAAPGSKFARTEAASEVLADVGVATPWPPPEAGERPTAFAADAAQ